MSNNQNNNYLSLSKLNCSIDDFSTDILDLVKAKDKGDLYKKFAQKFLTYIPIDYRSKDKLSLFGDFTNEAFQFFKKRTNNERKIEISKTNFQNNNAITILIIIENRPFIIDSLNCLTSRFGLQAIFTFHPVVFSKRDASGNLIDIVANGDEASRESLIFIKALGKFNEETIKTLKTEINRIIDLVDYTYNSWQILLNKLIGITTDIVHHKDIYEEAELPAEETLDFLNWLQKNNFTFLGMAEFNASSLKITHENGVKDIWQDNKNELDAIIEFSKSDYYSNKLAMLGKLNKISPVHRNALVDYILIKHLNKNGEYESGTIIFGLYGTAIYYQSIKSVPILRGKMNYVLDESGFPLNSYNAKKLKNIIESLPRDILIQIGETDLYCMCLHMLSSMLSKKLKFFIQQDWSSSFVNVIIFMPRERLTPEVYNAISKYLAEKFESDIITDNITVLAQDFAHLFATIPIKDKEKLNFSSKEIENDLIKISTNWSDALLEKLCEEYGEYDGGIKHKQIELAFTTEYKNKFSAETTIEDIEYLNKASDSNKTVFNLLQKSPSEFTLKIYSSSIYLTLSDTLPAIENLGFSAIDEQSFAIKPTLKIKQSWIYEFTLKSQTNIQIPFASLKKNIEAALEKVKEGVFSSDLLSKLLVISGIDWTKIHLLKALTNYLHQTGIPYERTYVQSTLIKHHQFTKQLFELFDSLFNPKSHSQKLTKSITKELVNYLDTVSNSTEDKVLRNMYQTILSIIRTNFYQTKNNEVKNYISFKFNSSKVPDLPLPRPYAEIFIYSNEFEGIHLRGGKVARGGIRWSNRGEDYRVEVLGLMKSQMTKNTVIVPVGSKGCFFVKLEQGSLSRVAYMEKVVECYKNFLRGLLDITDNLVNGKIVQPPKTIIHDDENPYLVVAADKGTATFSDYANQISQEYNFWLGDAFASGGSIGYDHKKMAITAKGAWISAQSHFYDMGKNIQSESFTVVGIGDMSGDVFGNGMLLSKYIKLIAAFNHMHIFIDPTPDCKSSYKERQRLFNLPGSKWSDYNPKLLSIGGGVFERSAKIIHLSKEIQTVLDLNVNSITPSDLIKAILKANIDLLWNGGIGTYIKSSLENNIDIGDKSNDVLRCDAKEIRAKVICEGGNLGVSQLGRIEYAMHGGRINTDFIDNSAGVSCSDHEVNIKIALNMALSSGNCTIEDRNTLLQEMTTQVEKLVLVDNYSQNLALTVAQKTPVLNIEHFSQLIRELEKESLLNREVEFLPKLSEISRRSATKEKLTRPELSILLSYSKMSVEKQLINSNIADDEYFEKYLIQYFPPLMRTKLNHEIMTHPLKKEIIVTIIANKLVNQLGGSLINALKKETGGELSDIAKSHAVICELFNLDILWQAVENLDQTISTEIKVDMFTDLAKIMRRGTSWFIKNIKSPINTLRIIEDYKDQTHRITSLMNKLQVGETKTKFVQKIINYQQAGISKDLATSIASLELLISTFDIIHVAKITNSKDEDVANLYFKSGDLLNIDWLRKSCELQIDDSYWNRLSIQSLKDDFYDKQRRFVTKIIKIHKNKIDLLSWINNNTQNTNIFTNFVTELKSQETINLNMLILANKKFELFLRKIKE
ncbi:MAG: NAD-glutamate dehydrogenase [Rickettsiaceae bacterium]